MRRRPGASRRLGRIGGVRKIMTPVGADEAGLWFAEPIADSWPNERITHDGALTNW